MSSKSYTLAYESLTADCAKPLQGKRGTREDLDEDTVKSCLASFAAISAIELVNVDPTIRLRFLQRQVVVFRSGNSLFFSPLPEASHTPRVCTPDEIVAHLADREPTPAEIAPTEAAPEVVTTPRRRGWKLSPGTKIALLAVTASIAAGLSYRELNRPPPVGYAWIDDSAVINELHGRLDGDYGNSAAPDSLSFNISGSSLSIYYTVAAGSARELVRSSGFHLAKRGEGVVALIASNGDLLELQPDGQLLFGDQTYARTTRP